MFLFGHLYYSEPFYYSCYLDQCSCCLSDNKSGGLYAVTNSARLLIDTSIIEVNPDINYLETNLKQIKTATKVFYRTCSQNHSFEKYSTSEFVVLNPSTDLANVWNLGLDHCLNVYCLNNHDFSSNHGFRCVDNTIRTLKADYVNRTCFSTISYMYIESVYLVNLGNGGFLADKKTNWNVVHLTLKYAKYVRVPIACEAFQFLTKLRTIKINSQQLVNLRCIFKSNPDLVKIVWDTIRIWNMCDETLDIWPLEEQNDDNIVKMIPETVDDKPEFNAFFYISLLIMFLFVVVYVIVKNRDKITLSNIASISRGHIANDLYEDTHI